MGVLTCLKVDSATNDVEFPLVLLRGADAVAQKIQSRWRFFLKEWFLDLREGMPYYREVFRKGFDLEVIKGTFRKTARNTAGVSAVRSLDLRFDSENRKLFVEDFVGITDEGEIIRSQDREPFVVDLY